MLTIERSAGTSIRIGDTIQVHVRRIRHRNRVRLAIEAPPSVAVERCEAGGDVVVRGDFKDFPVIIVEDDDNHALLIDKALRNAGVTETSVLTSGTAAIERLTGPDADHAALPRLVLLDLHLPDVIGISLLAALREAPHLATVPIVVLSAHADEDTVAGCMRQGANAFVAKTTDYRDLKDSVARIIRFWTQAE